MNRNLLFLAMVWCSYSYAGLRYVDLNSPSPAAPYSSWTTAARNIQDAIDVALAGDDIVVKDGVYATGGRVVSGSLTNRVIVDKAITVRSLNGPASTVIQGYQVPGTTNGAAAIRCVYMTNAAVLSGFTLAGGATLTNQAVDYNASEQAGGGVWCSTLEPLLTNCILTGNSAIGVGGGCFRGTLINCIICSNNVGRNGTGGGSERSALINCRILWNQASSTGAGADSGSLSNCIVQGNVGGWGGGVANSQQIVDCLIVSNTAPFGEGGGLNYCAVTNSVIMGNSAPFAGGTSSCKLHNCLVTGNWSEYGPGGVIGFNNRNCTITGNSSTRGVGGIISAGATNCIVYFNYGSAGISNYAAETFMDHCCTVPLPPNQTATITNDPRFVNALTGNFRLESGSPCINAGLNSAVIVLTDLGGNPRIVDGVVDMGAYEFQGASGALRILSVSASGADIRLLWESAAGSNYFLECSTNLRAPAYFFPIASNITGGPETTGWTHTNGRLMPMRFYRVDRQ